MRKSFSRRGLQTWIKAHGEWRLDRIREHVAEFEARLSKEQNGSGLMVEAADLMEEIQDIESSLPDIREGEDSPLATFANAIGQLRDTVWDLANQFGLPLARELARRNRSRDGPSR